jgi:signal transduction histidine kinase/CheY-like chemotaxis protein
MKSICCVGHTSHTLESVQHGDHVCCFYRDDEELRNLLVPFLADGIANNEKVQYAATNKEEGDKVIRWLQEEHCVDTSACMETAQLCILYPEDAYLKGNAFKVDSMIQLVESSVRDALASGYSAYRGAGNMAWAMCMNSLSMSVSLREVVAYEAALNRLFQVDNFKCIGLCLYDMRVFPASELLYVLTVHPYVFYNTKLCDNFYYIPPEDFFGSQSKPSATLFRYLQNLDERQQIEDELKLAKESAEETTRAKSSFLATVSHEIRTPMNGVLGASELMSQTALTTQQRELLDIIHKCGNHMLRLIDHVLDMSKIESGKLTLHIMPFALLQCVFDAITVCISSVQRKGLRIIAKRQCAGLPTHVDGDCTRISQILINLITNAVKFSDEGEIVIEIEAQYTPNADPNVPSRSVLTFSVSDNGVGIPEDKIPSIFDPFTQLTGSATAHRGGFGLGLTITKKFVEVMGGDIVVLSPGKLSDKNGSTFIFTFPTNGTGLITSENPGENGANMSGSVILFDSQYNNSVPPVSMSPVLPEREVVTLAVESSERLPQLDVLIVEDNVINRKIMVKMLTSCQVAQISFDIAMNGQEAVQHALTKQYDLVLMDLHMPIMDGYTASKEIRQRMCPNRGPLIIAITAAMLDDTKETCAKFGIDGVIPKPVTAVTVKKLVQHAIKHKDYVYPKFL